MLARALIVVASAFPVLLSLILVDAQDHVVNHHMRREVDTNHSFKKRSSQSASRERRAAESLLKSSRGFSPAKRGILEPFVGNGQDHHEHEGFLQGIVHGVPPYDACHPNGPIPTACPGDPPFTQGQFSYEKSLTCPNGVHAPNGVVLLIPGTGCDGAQTYAKGPFGIGLPRAGYAVCWMDPPSRLMVDIQISAEFVAYAVGFLAQQSGGRISVVAYSQGGLVTQWALTFWPSLHPLVKNFVAIAPTLKGTVLTQAVCGGLDLAGGCFPSTLQMSQRSNLVRALRRVSGGHAQVPTTTIFTFTDDLVQPQRTNDEGVSWLNGASNIPIQQACPNLNPDHFGIVTSQATYGIAFDAFSNGRPASLSTFNRRFCNPVGDLMTFSAGIGRYLQLTWRGLIGNPGVRGGMVLKELTTLSVPAEPRLQDYVCSHGAANDCTRGFCGPQPRENPVKGALGNDALGGVLKGDGLKLATGLLGQGSPITSALPGLLGGGGGQEGSKKGSKGLNLGGLLR